MYIKCPYYKQSTNFSCWPTSVKMLLDFWDNTQSFSEEKLIKLLDSKAEIWTDNNAILDFFVKSGYKVYFSKKWDIENIIKFLDLWLPILVNYRNILSKWWHFALIVWYNNNVFYFNDPVYGDGYKITKKHFLNIGWIEIEIFKIGF